MLADGEDAWTAAILEHVEPAGVHSGDSACVLPGPSVTPELDARVRDAAALVARAVGARGLLNLQLAFAGGRLYVLEANPRASRTVAFVAKATGVPLVEHAVRLLLGESLARPRPAGTRRAGPVLGEGGGVPVGAVRRRRRPRARDALDRRGDGLGADRRRGLPARPARGGEEHPGGRVMPPLQAA